ncbi:MAG: glycosyltransferase family 4 protein [Aggregatilineales bacterium]
MNVALLNVKAPFVTGGAEYLIDSLATKIIERGHRVVKVEIPFNWNTPQHVLSHMLACRLIRLDPETIDLAIAIKFPAYYVPFTNKKLWLVHQFRQVYELWGTNYQLFPSTPEGEGARAMVIAADDRYLREAKAIYTNSRIVAGRLKRFNNIDADGILYPPLLNPELFKPGEFGDYFFYPSRMNTIKRQELAIEAMRHVRSKFKLVLAGKADHDAYEKHLRYKIAHYGLTDRVKLLGFISDEEKARLMSNAYAALYIPFDEDSYGYVSLEAFHSHKPVITMIDSGGTDEVIEDGLNGLILQPSAEALAEGMERLWADRAATRAMGEAAFETLDRHGIRWEHILEKLLGK